MLLNEGKRKKLIKALNKYDDHTKKKLSRNAERQLAKIDFSPTLYNPNTKLARKSDKLWNKLGGINRAREQLRSGGVKTESYLNAIAEALANEPEILDELSDKMHHRYRRLAKSDIADTKMGGKIKAPGSYTAAGFTPGDRARAKAMIKKRRDGISLSRYLQYGAE